MFDDIVTEKRKSNCDYMKLGIHIKEVDLSHLVSSGLVKDKDENEEVKNIYYKRQRFRNTKTN